MNINSLVATAFILCVFGLRAATLTLPNASFESPETTFATNRIDAWQDNPTPFWYNEAENGPWDLLTGVFTNVPGPSGPIDNMHGNQAAFLFVLPQAGFFQDYNSVDWAHTSPTHEFNATFQRDKAYELTVALIGGGGGMREGASLAAALYYRDASSNMVFVAMTNVVHSLALFPSTTHFVDIPVVTPVVSASDPHANQNIGIAIFSTIMDTNFIGGYWDIDNVRLREIERPRLLTRRVGQVTVEAESGLRFDILVSDRLTTPFVNWAVLGTVETVNGAASFQDPSTSKSPRFYIARWAP